MVCTKNQKGISLLTLIITIITIIILSVVTMKLNSKSLDEAAIVKFKQEITDVKKGVETIKLINSKDGLSEEALNKGFLKVKVAGENIPLNFVSFDSGEMTAYLIDLELIDYKKIKTGHGYKEIEANDTVTFDVDDVYVYDKNGTVYYLKGTYLDGDEPYYTIDQKRTYGPKVVATNTVGGTIKIEVTPINGGIIENVTVNGAQATGIDTINNTKIFECVVTKNGTYTIFATEKKYGTTKTLVKVTKIVSSGDVQEALTGIIKINGKDDEHQDTINQNATLEIETNAELIFIKHVTNGITPIKPTKMTPGWEKAISRKNLYLSQGENIIYVWFRNTKGDVILEKSKSITLEALPGTEEIPVPEISYSPVEGYTQKGQVTIKYPDTANEEKYEKCYRIAGGEWQVVEDLEIKLEIEQNIKVDAVVIARVGGDTALGKIVSVTINNIDKNAPIIGDIVFEPTESDDGINLKGTAILKDNESKIKEYQITNTNVEPTTWEKVTEGKEVKINFNVIAGRTYYIWAKDLAGNISYKQAEAIIKYEVTYNANGGTIGKTTEVEAKRIVRYGETYGESVDGMPIVNNDGYVFAGWYTKNDGTGELIEADTIVKKSANGQTLYAKWKEAAIAIYSSGDNSLNFIIPKAGETYEEGKTFKYEEQEKEITKIYTGFEIETYTNATQVPWYSEKDIIQTVNVRDEVMPIATNYYFNNLENLRDVDLGKFNLENTESMEYMFTGCKYLEKVTIGEKFKWSGENSYLPVPNSGDIEGANGRWYDFRKREGEEGYNGYEPKDVPIPTLGEGEVTYYACKPGDAVSIVYNIEGYGLVLTFAPMERVVYYNNYSWDARYDVDKDRVADKDEPKIYKIITYFKRNSYTGTLANTFSPWNDYADRIRKVFVDDVYKPEGCGIKVRSTLCWFKNFSKLEDLDLVGIDTSDADWFMDEMFRNCGKSTLEIDISHLKTGNIKSMSQMFYKCGAKKINISNLDTSNVKDGENMFAYCRTKEIIAKNTFNKKPNNFQDFEFMFIDCKYLEILTGEEDWVLRKCRLTKYV